MTPMNKLPHAKPTKAELGTEKTKLAGYMRAIADNLLKRNSKVLAIYDQQMISNNAETQESNCNHP